MVIADDQLLFIIKKTEELDDGYTRRSNFSERRGLNDNYTKPT
jgi:hypothetical protein